jgi:Carbohydrate phosphorylase
MRLLVDEHDLDWDTAWHITQQIFGYTNHTLLPETLERWPISLFGHLLPRHMKIVCSVSESEIKSAEPQGRWDALCLSSEEVVGNEAAELLWTPSRKRVRQLGPSFPSNNEFAGDTPFFIRQTTRLCPGYFCREDQKIIERAGSALSGFHCAVCDQQADPVKKDRRWVPRNHIWRETNSPGSRPLNANF